MSADSAMPLRTIRPVYALAAEYVAKSVSDHTRAERMNTLIQITPLIERLRLTRVRRRYMFTATEMSGMTMRGVNRNVNASGCGRPRIPSMIDARNPREAVIIIAERTRFLSISIIILD